MGDLTTASSTALSSASAAGAGTVATGAGVGGGGCCGITCGVAIWTGAASGGYPLPALRTRSFNPSRSSSNSASSCCFTSSRIRSMSSKSNQPPKELSDRRRGQNFAPRLGHQHVVFDPHAAESLDVDTRLNRKNHARRERHVRQPRYRPTKSRLLVHFEAEAVPCSVSERMTHTVSVQYRPCGSVDLGRHHTRPNSRDRGLLSFGNRSINAPELGVNRP